jgi:hypothetical protein
MSTRDSRFGGKSPGEQVVGALGFAPSLTCKLTWLEIDLNHYLLIEPRRTNKCKSHV